MMRLASVLKQLLCSTMLELQVRLKTVMCYEFDWLCRVLLRCKLVNICTLFTARNLNSTPTTVQPVGV